MVHPSYSFVCVVPAVLIVGLLQLSFAKKRQNHHCKLLFQIVENYETKHKNKDYIEKLSGKLKNL